MAARNKPAGIRLLVYGIDKGKGGIEGFERVWTLKAHKFGLAVEVRDCIADLIESASSQNFPFF